MYRILLTTLCLNFFNIYAQNPVLPGYTPVNITLGAKDHSYFSFKLAQATKITQSGWDIALYNEHHEIGGKVNETVGARMWRVFKDTTSFASISLSDTTFPVYNNDSFMYLGALDTIYTGSFANVFYVGLGILNPGVYNVIGDKVYIIKKEDGSFAKFFLVKYEKTGTSDRIYTFKYANIDNSNLKYVTVNKQSVLANHYQYLNFNSGVSSTTFEPTNYKDWDLVFKPYDVMSGNTATRFSMGILSNNSFNLIRFSKVVGLPDVYLNDPQTSTEVVKMSGNPASVVYNNSLDGSKFLTYTMNHIGASWYEGSTTNVKKDESYYLKTNEGCIYHVVLNAFNTSTNTLDFSFKLVKCITNSVSDWNKNEDNFLIENLENNLKISTSSEKIEKIEIYDISGKNQLIKLEHTNEILVPKSLFSSKLILVKCTTTANTYYKKFNID